jgi:hypothetical protein
MLTRGCPIIIRAFSILSPSVAGREGWIRVFEYDRVRTPWHNIENVGAPFARCRICDLLSVFSGQKRMRISFVLMNLVELELYV